MDKRSGMVIVSHVSDIPKGIKRLLTEVAPDVSITLAGGTDDDQVGTSFEKILDAIESNTCDTIYALYDLGSAKMNIEMAMENTSKKIYLMHTALLESAYALSVLLQIGVDETEIENQLAPLIVK